MSEHAESMGDSKEPSKVGFKKQLFAEFIGTAALLCSVIGSGIMAERLSAGNVGVALIANTLATVFALFVLIEIFGPISGAHFNPLVTLVIYSKNRLNSTSPAVFTAYKAIFFIAIQILGSIAGAWLANAMFELPVLQLSTHVREGLGQWLAEAVATAGLIIVILRSTSSNVVAKASTLVACYIGAAYWFTASTSFANPAAVMGRMLSDSFAGIAPASALGFVLAQTVGAVIGTLINQCLDGAID
jgi:glycerol uptake facilitator-like aquaporin